MSLSVRKNYFVYFSLILCVLVVECIKKPQQQHLSTLKGWYINIKSVN